MTRIPMNDVGTEGIVKDLDDHSLPLNAWSNGQNVRFDDNKAIKFKGDTLVFNPPAVPPYFAMSVQTADDVFWLYAGLSKVYAFQAGTHSNITRIKTSPSFISPPSELSISSLAPVIEIRAVVPVEQLAITPTAPSIAIAPV